MATSLHTLETWHGAIVAAQQQNEKFFRDRIDAIRGSTMPIAQVMSDVRACVGGVIIGQSTPLGVAKELIDVKKYREYHATADAETPQVEAWVSRFSEDTASLELKDPDTVRRAGQAIHKLAEQTRTLAVLAKMLELAMRDAPSESNVDFEVILEEVPAKKGKGVPPGDTGIMDVSMGKPTAKPATSPATKKPAK
jgi:hypothetical protein